MLAWIFLYINVILNILNRRHEIYTQKLHSIIHKAQVIFLVGKNYFSLHRIKTGYIFYTLIIFSGILLSKRISTFLLFTLSLLSDNRKIQSYCWNQKNDTIFLWHYKGNIAIWNNICIFYTFSIKVSFFIFFNGPLMYNSDFPYIIGYTIYTHNNML
jgi:hypothetical protein